ncbi:hypothetical protein B0H15DRAFT_287304 [Mycena belliarum]|uniref:Uncharacterized protein n=1 Tax=Mycena belliarum TaxID=1033014 RepID=A0AAD6U4D9_9AGAR|nr:hypothetical protein B0H15DRAFT_287304 [Mycena belliae]
MTEYDYSPEAYNQHLQTQSRIKDWTSQTAQSQPCHPETPPTPAALRSKPLPASDYPVPAVPPYKKSGLQRRRDASGAPIPPDLNLRKPNTAPAPVPNQIYQYTQKSTPFGAQLNISAQTTNGAYVQQQLYQQTVHAVRSTPQTLQVPMINYAPLARNPYPAEEHLQLPGPGPDALAPRVRSKSSHAPRAPPPGLGGDGIHGPPVPPMPDRPRAHSSVRPAGAAAPLQPANGAYMNGVYAAPQRTFKSSVSSLQLPPRYLHASAQQYPLPEQQTRKSKSSATLQSRYAAEARYPRVEQVPPMPAPHQAQMGFYTLSRESKSSATLHPHMVAVPAMPAPHKGQQGFYAVPKASKSAATLYGQPRVSSRGHHHRQRDASMPEKMSSSHPAASQMLVHSLAPYAAYHKEAPAPRSKAQPLLKRIFGKKSG